MSFGSQFAPPIKNIKAGFDRIMSGTSIPEKVKTQLYQQYEVAIRAGSPAMINGAFDATITENFDWPWFENHRMKFEKDNLRPYMWRRGKYPYDEIQEPTNTDDLLKMMIVKELREVVKELIPGFTLPRTKDALVEVLAELPFDQLRAAKTAHSKVNAMIQKDKKRRADPNFDLKFKLALLHHSVTMAVYSGLRSEQIAELDEIYMHDKYEVIVPVRGCAVEEQVARQFNLGLLHGTPPRFSLETGQGSHWSHTTGWLRADLLMKHTKGGL